MTCHSFLSCNASWNGQIADWGWHPAPSYQAGQKLWLSTRDQHLLGPSHKQGPRIIGPFEEDSIFSPLSVSLRLPPRLKVHSVFHIYLLKSVETSSLASPPTPPPPPQVIDGEPVYMVKEILDCGLRGTGIQYLVDCEEYGPEEHKWFLSHGSSARNLSVISTQPTLLNQVVRQEPSVWDCQTLLLKVYFQGEWELMKALHCRQNCLKQ